MNSHVLNQVLIFIIEAIAIIILLLGLFRIRLRLGLSPLYVTLGVFQPIQMILASSIYVKMNPDLLISPGSAVMFTASLFAILMIYIREDAIEARKVIYGIVFANLAMILPLLTFRMQLELPDTLYFFDLSRESFNQNIRVILSGTFVLFIDVFLIIFVYEWMRHLFLRIPFLRIYFTMASILTIDTLLFATGAFFGETNYRMIVLTGIVGKAILAAFYAIALTVYLRFIEPVDLANSASTQPYQDIFYALTYREKYKIEQKRAKQILQESEERYRGIVEDLPVLICSFLPGGKITFVNKTYCEYFGKTSKELIGSNFQMLIPEAERETVLADISALTFEAPIQSHEHQVISANGQIHWQRWSNRALFNAQREIIAYQSVGEDITDRKLTEEKLHQKDKVLRKNITELNAIINALPGIVSVIDTDFNVLVENEEVYRRFGQGSLHEIIGKKCYQTRMHLKEPCPQCGLLIAFETGETVIRYSTPEEEQLMGIATQVYAVPLKDENGKIWGGVEITMDISELRRAEKEIQKSEERLKLALQGADLGLWDWNIQTGDVVFNERWAEMLGYTLDEIDPNVKSWENLVHPDDIPHVTDVLNAHLRGETPIYSIEHRMRTKDGNWKWILDRGKVLEWDDEEKPLRAVGTHLDITELKLADEALRQRVTEMAALNAVSIRASHSLSMEQVISEAVQAVLEATQASIAFLLMKEGDNLTPKQIIFSEAIQELDKFPIHEVGACLCGTAVSERRPIFSTNLYNDPLCTWSECKQAGLRSAAALPLFRGEEIIAVLGLGSVLARDFEEQSEFLAILASEVAHGLQNAMLHQEISSHAVKLERRVEERTSEINKRIQQVERLNEGMVNLMKDLQASKEYAENSANRLTEANTELESFAYSVSHDLRAPLRAIHGFSQILSSQYQKALDAEGQRYLEIVMQAGEQMGHLIDDLLQYSRLGRRAISKQQVDCQQILMGVIKQLTEQIYNSQANIQIPEPLPTIVNGDETLINQILLNLVDNAIKYCIPGQAPQVTITWSQDKEHLFLQVQDKGIGIPLEYQEKIFDVFQRLHNEEEYPGTGIGLALVKKAVDLMNGQLGVKSQPNQGSTFWVRLPLTIMLIK